VVHIKYNFKIVVDTPNYPDLKNLLTMFELCQFLSRTIKSMTFYLIDRLIGIIFTLLVRTTTTKRFFLR